MPGHYPAGHIPFLFPPPGIVSILVIASLVLPNMTLGILVWYIDPPAKIPPSQPRPYHALTLIQPIPMTPAATSVPLQPQQEQSPIAKACFQRGKPKRKYLKHKAP